MKINDSEVLLRQGNYLLLGLSDMATKSSHGTMETFKDIRSDVDRAVTT